MQERWVRSLGWEDPLEEGMATHSILVWEIPWTEKPGGLQSTGLQSIGHDLATEQQLQLAPSSRYTCTALTEGSLHLPLFTHLSSCLD